LINCDFRFSPKVIEESKKILEILNPRVQSIYKIIAKVNADSDEQLYEIIMRNVREIEGIKNTFIIIEFEGPKREAMIRESNSYFQSFLLLHYDSDFK
jgi:DNA-binding Lrp family transcriptional regulator